MKQFTVILQIVALLGILAGGLTVNMMSTSGHPATQSVAITGSLG